MLKIAQEQKKAISQRRSLQEREALSREATGEHNHWKQSDAASE
jgi:hypothetical protein